MKHRIRFVLLAVLAFALLPRPALAAFHIMEIEQVIGGVDGDTTAQAVQLKMRTTLQNQLFPNAQLVVRDAVGANPVTLSTFGTSTATNPASGACREVLLVTAAMAAKTTPAVTGDYTMAAIPASYLAAGTLSFETAGGGATYWRVSWGGASYSGPDTVVAGTGGVANDADGHTAPPFPGPLPSSSAQALHFTPACSLTNLSTNSAADYAPTTGSATLKNNAATSFVVGLPIPTLPEAARFLLPVLLGFGVLVFAYKRRRRA
jgi:hypothetical protein